MSKFTKAELHHLLGLLYFDKEEGNYSGVKEHYYKRTDVLIAKLNNMQKELQNDKK